MKLPSTHPVDLAAELAGPAGACLRAGRTSEGYWTFIGPFGGVSAATALRAVLERDPACKGYVQPLLYFKGFLALQSHRVGHWLWGEGREAMAFYLQSRVSELFQVDIHPAASMGQGAFFDHGTGIVIGETARIGDDVSMLHGVTLGGTGAERGDRHPKIRRGSLISLGAKVLGNIEIGEYSRVGAGSVVLTAVPAGCTAVGFPAKLVNCKGSERPSHEMNHIIDEHTGREFET